VLNTTAAKLFPSKDPFTYNIRSHHCARPPLTLKIEEIERSLIRGLIQQGAAY